MIEKLLKILRNRTFLGAISYLLVVSTVCFVAYVTQNALALLGLLLLRDVPVLQPDFEIAYAVQETQQEVEEGQESKIGFLAKL